MLQKKKKFGPLIHAAQIVPPPSKILPEKKACHKSNGPQLRNRNSVQLPYPWFNVKYRRRGLKAALVLIRRTTKIETLKIHTSIQMSPFMILINVRVNQSMSSYRSARNNRGSRLCLWMRTRYLTAMKMHQTNAITEVLQKGVLPSKLVETA